MTDRQLNHFAVLAFADAHWQASSDERERFLADFAAEVPILAESVHVLSVYPARADADVLIWSAMKYAEPASAGDFFLKFARVTAGWRRFLRPAHTLWGLTRQSQYTAGASEQEIDPFSPRRRPYLVIYPFSKTSEWYILPKEKRQKMMMEHIRVGKQYPDITQLLLYSTGLQDQEFIVAYETDDLAHFSDLVVELRSTTARPYTLLDTPIYTGVWRPLPELVACWK